MHFSISWACVKSGTGVVLCIDKALSDSGVSREDVNYVNAHATSTPSGDLKEFQALIRCFGNNPEVCDQYVPSCIERTHTWYTKVSSYTERTDSLSDRYIPSVPSGTAIRTGWVHPNINLDKPEESVDVSVLVGAKKERLDVKVALSNSFGFGGHNSSILFAPYDE
ncbi:hypothetical protein BHM03_00004296 [Ensete ventricosum]|uniref:beta-ketoacyl-[acyl-carrier-protein] synthase I n=1 Tax=Ensete ventricosum TaxID=4639 RepID=A0A445MAI2_ENSVE|nr:hypothetical protein BHM03_00004296 [Ensete ventricosum]